MARITELLELLNTLIQSNIHDTIEIGKGTLSNIQTCLQNEQDKIEFLQLESKLKYELQQKIHQFELIFVQNKLLVESEVNSHQLQKIIKSLNLRLI